MSGTPTDPLTPGGSPPNPNPPATDPNPTPAGAGGSAPPAPEEGEIRLSSKALQERLTRAAQGERSKLLKDLGVSDEEALRKVLRDAEAARQASMTNEQRLTEENNRLQRERDQALEAQREAQFVATLSSLCATRGIKDLEYARYLVERAAPDGDGDFNAGAFLDEELKRPERRVALGVDGASPTQVPVPVNTSPVDMNRPAPTPNGKGSQVVNAMDLAPDALKKYERAQYGS